MTKTEPTRRAPIFREPEDVQRTARHAEDMPMPVRIGLGLVAAGVAVLGGLAAASYWNTGEPSTFAVLPIADPYAARAEKLILKPNPTKADLDLAEKATRTEISIAPRRTDGHLRLAIIEVLRDGGLTVPALNELKTSYKYAPLDPDYFAPRIRFALEHWGELDDDVRAHVATEIAVTSKYRPNTRLRDLIMAVQNPQGRLGGLMSLSLDPTQTSATPAASEPFGPGQGRDR